MMSKAFSSRALAPIRNLPQMAVRPQLASPRPVIPIIRTYASKQPGPNAQFYKTFARPIAKVFLLAIFIYQVAYFGWVRLETNEAKFDLQATINELEARVSELEKARSGKVKSP